MLRRAEGLLAICLGEAWHPGTQVMLERLQSISETRAGIRVVNVAIAPYHTWAERHDALGTPTLLLFRRGRLVRRVRGIQEEKLLRNLLESL